MKKFALKTLAIVLFVSTAITSCSSNDDSETIISKSEFATAVTGPETGLINQEITFQVNFEVENECGEFKEFAQTASGNTKTIQIQSLYTGTNCGTTDVARTEPYKFTVNTAGTYVFKFKSSASTFITKTVVIE